MEVDQTGDFPRVSKPGHSSVVGDQHGLHLGADESYSLSPPPDGLSPNLHFHKLPPGRGPSLEELLSALPLDNTTSP